ncbi:uncharacterized protein [Danio rerio]|uniref:Uncharacterized protein n=4 Tax=Danio rerio TaxID=7955 RepID=A0AC58I7J1_DANRE
MTTPSRMPFAEAIQALSVLHQQQHETLVELKNIQEQHFQVLMEAQREDREQIRSLLSQGIRPAPTSAAHPPIALQKMVPEDDPEVFLDLFEKMAEACGWPRAEWPVRVIPLLSGEAQIAAQQLPAQNLLEYAHLKRAILQRAGRNPEEQRQLFRSLVLAEGGRPFAFAQQLRDACRRWLVQDGRTTAQLVDAVVLEQFITRLPSRTLEWVQCHRPDDLETAIRLAEDHLVARSRVGEITSLSSPPLSLSLPVPRPRLRGPPTPAPRRRCAMADLPNVPRGAGPHSGRGVEQRPLAVAQTLPGFSPVQSVAPAGPGGIVGRSGPMHLRRGHEDSAPKICSVKEASALIRVPATPIVAPGRNGLYRVPVSIKGGTYQALVDSGCNQTSIHQSLLQDPALDMSRTVRVRCVHGDIIHYPLTAIDIQFRGKKHRVEVAVNPHLKHPLILGTNWPGFNRLLGVLCAGASWKKKSPDRGRVAQLGESQAVTSRADSGEGLGISRCKDFPLEQSRDDTLKHALERVQVIDGKILQPDRPLSYPYFAVINDRVYRVTQDAQTKEDTTQLLVPKSRREMLFQAAHSNPMAGHLGQAATLNRLMTRFFWPGIHGDVSRWCAACSECQLVNPPATPKAP